MKDGHATGASKEEEWVGITVKDISNEKEYYLEKVYLSVTLE